MAARLSWRIATSGATTWLLARNDGTAHDKVSNIALAAPGGRKFTLTGKGPPYVLADGQQGWRIVSDPPAPGSALRLTASTALGTIEQDIRVESGPVEVKRVNAEPERAGP